MWTHLNELYDFETPVVRIVSVSFFTVFMGTSGAGASCKFYNSNCNSCEATFLHSFDACKRTSASCTILKLQNAPLNAGVSRSLGHHVRQHNHFCPKFQIQVSYLTAWIRQLGNPAWIWGGLHAWSWPSSVCRCGIMHRHRQALQPSIVNSAACFREITHQGY